MLEVRVVSSGSEDSGQASRRHTLRVMREVDENSPCHAQTSTGQTEKGTKSVY